MEKKIKFINNYISALTPADGSKFDSNANVTQKTVATLEAELFKEETIKINRKRLYDKMVQMFGVVDAEMFEQLQANHFVYVNDETSLKPYCASISLYPFILEGTKCIGGVSSAPKNLQSFNGGFVNFVYQVASNFAGAVATVEYLKDFDYFARKTYGEDYLTTNKRDIIQEFQGVVYAMNQPASARGDQSVFWNISIFDEFYFKEMFGEFFYPDGSQPKWESVKALQKVFLEFFREERTKALLTFPVVTVAMLTEEDTGEPRDKDLLELCATEMSLGHSFFIYMSNKADSLSSCCRLRNEMEDNTFSYTLGAGGVSTGSFKVITLNMNRISQDRLVKISGILDVVYKALASYRELFVELIEAGMLPAYTAGLVTLDRQFGTIGLNGVLEGFEYYSQYSEYDYKVYLVRLLSSITLSNKEAKEKYGFRFNTEFIPAENLGVKNAKWDKEDGWFVPRDCYNSYFYPVENDKLTILDKVNLHGKDVSVHLDGGSALHLNLDGLLSVEQAKQLFLLCGKHGVPYWTYNVLSTICNDCEYIDPHTLQECSKCGSKNVDYGTRIIGYLKRITNFSSPRQKEAHSRAYHKVNV